MGTQGGDRGTRLGACTRMLRGVAQHVEHLLRRSAGRVGLFLALSVLPVRRTLAQSSFGGQVPVALAKSVQCSWYWLVQP